MMDNVTHSQADTPQILVVDDTAANLRLLTDMLSNNGYQVRPASSGRLALRSVEADLPGLILLDVRMPEWVMERVSSIQYDGKKAVLGYFMDITARKRPQETLSASKARCRDILGQTD